MNLHVDPHPFAEPCSCSHAGDARGERRLEMLAELADVGLDLAKAVAVHVKAQMVKADEDWATQLPKDPSAAFANLAQTVRRTLALEVHLREGLEAHRTSLFAGPPRRGIDLNPPPVAFAALRKEKEPSVESAPRLESLQHDLGRLLDDPERFLEAPIGHTDGHIAVICENLGLDVGRVRYENGVWVVKADPAARSSRDEPLKTWRPPMPGGPSVREPGIQEPDDARPPPPLRGPPPPVGEESAGVLSPFWGEYGR